MKMTLFCVLVSVSLKLMAQTPTFTVVNTGVVSSGKVCESGVEVDEKVNDLSNTVCTAANETLPTFEKDPDESLVTTKVREAFKDKIEKINKDLESANESLDKAKKSGNIERINNTQNKVDDLNRVKNNLETKIDQIASQIVNKECKGMLNQVKITETKVKAGKTSDGNANHILAEFGSQAEADNFVLQKEQDLLVTKCKVTKLTKDEIKFLPESISQTTVEKHRANGKSFLDNSYKIDDKNPYSKDPSNLATPQVELNNKVDEWKSQTGKSKDSIGRDVEKKITKVNVYSCASTLLNCSKTFKNDLSSSNKFSDKETSCDMLDLMREFSDKELQNYLKLKRQQANLPNIQNAYERKQEKESIEKSLANAKNTAIEKFINERNTNGDSISIDTDFLARVLDNETYHQYTSSVGSSKLYEETEDKEADGERRLWLALSTMRGLSAKDTVKKQLMKDQVVSISEKDIKDYKTKKQIYGDVPLTQAQLDEIEDDKLGIKFNVVSTGHPDDQFNNSKIDGIGSQMAGTCGPLPKTDQYYGKCNKSENTKSPCESGARVCKGMKDYYDTKQSELANYRKIFGENEEDVYSPHRYIQVEPEFEETVTETKETKVITERFQVSCSQLSFRCDKKDLIPEVNSSFSFGGGNSNQGATQKGGWGSVSCPAF